MTTDKKAKILLVDDEEHFRHRLSRALARRGHEVLEAEDYQTAITAVEDEQPEMAIIDLKMPGPSGLDLVRDALVKKPDLRIVVLTGYGSISTATEAIRLGAINYLSKPADAEEILAAFNLNSPATKKEQEEIATPSLARAEWEHINRVLTDCGGNISEAAKRLQLHRRTLQRKLLKFPPMG